MYLLPLRVFKPPHLALSKAGNLVAPLLFSSIRVTVSSLKPTAFNKSEPVRSLSSRWSPHPLSLCLHPHTHSIFAPPSIPCSSFCLCRLGLESLVCSPSLFRVRVLGNRTGNPGVIQGYPYPYPPNTHTRAEGMGIPGYGWRVLRVGQVPKPMRVLMTGSL
jgi:hypothetical protein